MTISNISNRFLRIAVYVSIFFSVWFANSIASTLKPTAKQMDIVRESIHFVFSDSFGQAYELIGTFEDSAAGAPLATLLNASILLSEMSDDEDYDKKNEFFKLIDSAAKNIKKHLKDRPDDPWGYFFLGSVYGQKSVFYGLQKSWLKAYISGMKAKNRFAEAVKIDSTIYDAYTGIGNYHYWSSLRLRKFLPFLPDNKERGLSELKLAMDQSEFSLYPAMGGLSWALIYDKKLRDAVKIGKELYKETNGGRISLWILGGAYWRTGNLKMAEKYYTELIDSLKRKGNQNNYNLIFCHYRRGVARFFRRQYEDAYTDLIKIGSFEVSEKVRDRHKKTYEKTDEYLEKIKLKLEINRKAP